VRAVALEEDANAQPVNEPIVTPRAPKISDLVGRNRVKRHHQKPAGKECPGADRHSKHPCSNQERAQSDKSQTMQNAPYP
jgi:hypothetical protein